MSNRPGPVPKLPFVLLGLMTLATFAGPFAIALTIAGGRSPTWPPDRPIEWAVFVIVTGTVVVLMIACLSVGALNRRHSAPRGGGTNAGEKRAT